MKLKLSYSILLILLLSGKMVFALRQLKNIEPHPYCQVHLDFHTSEFIPVIGEKFDKKQFQEALKPGHEIGVNGPIYFTIGYLANDAEQHPELTIRNADGSIAPEGYNFKAKPSSNCVSHQQASKINDWKKTIKQLIAVKSSLK